jgi:NAD-dependent SIR2 family protein deacetylase
MIAFTGAGISTAAGIDDYATKAKGSSITSEGRPHIKHWRDAMPTKSHHILTALYEQGYLKHWIQQNHDSLPQKAGYPQYALNEIHGSLHDPANPIVPYEGQLRSDLYSWMLHWESKADLCLALGTSLSGFTADNVPINIAQRYLDKGEGLGLVIINLQCTPYDHLATLRIYGTLDHVLALLAEELLLDSVIQSTGSLYPHAPLTGSVIEEDVFRIPFDSEGFYSETESQVLDLREGSWLQLTAGPYARDIGRCLGRSPDGHYKISFTESVHPIFNILRRPFTLTLGYWWVDLLTRGISYGIEEEEEEGGESKRRERPIPLMTIHRREVKEQQQARHLGGAAIAADCYLKMMRYGVDEEGIKQKLKIDGVKVSEIDEMYERLVVSFRLSSSSPAGGSCRSPNSTRRALDTIESFLFNRKIF